MSVPVQRWLFGRDSYRPSGECINPREYEVAELAGDSIAKAFVLTHHYAGTYPAARFRFGLFRGERLVGVAVYSVPCNDRVLACLPGSPRESVELGRFVLEDCVPGNGESWFLARTFTLLRAKGLVGVVSFSDPVRRRSHAGALVFPGHVGIIYQASSAHYLGTSRPSTLLLLPDGQVFSGRARQKVRAREQGWRYAARQLEVHGATPLEDGEDARAWLRRWLPRLTTRLPHSGNLRCRSPLGGRPPGPTWCAPPRVPPNGEAREFASAAGWEEPRGAARALRPRSGGARCQCGCAGRV